MSDESQENPTHQLIVPRDPTSAPIISDFLARCALIDKEVHSERVGDFIVTVAW